MKSICDDIQNKLYDYADGLLSASEITEVEKHIEACSECNAEYHKLKRLIAELNSLPTEPLPHNFSESLKQRLANVKKPVGTSFFANNWRGFSAVAAGILFILLIKTGYFDNFRNIKTAYVDDTELVMVEGEKPVEVIKKDETPIPTASKEPQPTKKPSPKIKDTEIKENITAQNEIQAEKQAADNNIMKYDEANTDNETELITATPENMETESSSMKMRSMSAPVPAQSFSGSSHDMDAPSFVSVNVKVDDYPTVASLLKEKFKPSETDDSIVLELQDEDFKYVMDFLMHYGAKVTQEDINPESSNIITITAK